MDWSIIIAAAFVAAKVLLSVVAAAFLVSGIDDFFIDAVHILRSIYRRLFVLRKYQPLTVDHLAIPDEQPIAVMIPAWDESVVIGKMLENTFRSVNYSNYRVFVGVYPNDPETEHEIYRIRERYDNVHLILCPKDGPTNKADCLNWIYQGILNLEEDEGTHFEIFVMHDAEDIIHPLSLKLFNYLIPRKDMVQLPVFPLETDWYNFTAGHYIDEFAETHSKDLLVREVLSGSIPSAGVGCAFSRLALDKLASETKKQLFSIETLTEDYEIGLRLRELGDLEQVFVAKGIERRITRRSKWTGKVKEYKVKEYIATREFFPKTLRAVVRQKARWVVGIALQGWSRIGWKGGGWTKHQLFRDRKALFTNQVNFLGYLVLTFIIGVWLVGLLLPDAYRYPPLVEVGSWLWYVILVDTFFLVWRALIRVVSVKRIYGWKQALLSLPRQVWLNVINFLATSRAMFQFARYLITGELIPWDKTAHVYPTDEELRSYRRKLGELLLEKRFLSVRELDEALAVQKRDGRPLGSILIESGSITEDQLVQALGVQLQISTREIDPYQVPLEVLNLVPRALAIKYAIFPLEFAEGNRLILASEDLLSSGDLREIEQALDRNVELVLTTRSDLSFSIARGYERLQQQAGPALGRLLLEQGIISQTELENALKKQRRSYKKLGDVLSEIGAISPQRLNEANEKYSAELHGRFGAFLVQHGFITLEQLNEALDRQQRNMRRLGDILLEQGLITVEVLERHLAKVPG